MKDENLYSPKDAPPIITPGVPLNSTQEEKPKPVDPLPESTRPRKDGLGGD